MGTISALKDFPSLPDSVVGSLLTPVSGLMRGKVGVALSGVVFVIGSRSVQVLETHALAFAAAHVVVCILMLRSGIKRL